MICNRCGANIPEESAFCNFCGAPVAPPAPPATPYEAPYEAPYYAPPVMPRVSSTPVLVLGIVAAAVAELGIPGIILGAIGKRKAAEYQAAGGPLTGKARVGSILSKVGFGVGIGFTVFWTLFILFYILLLVFIFRQVF